MAQISLILSIFNLLILFANTNQSEQKIFPNRPRPTIPPIKNCRDKAWCKDQFKGPNDCFDNYFRTEGCPYSCYQCELCGDNFKFCNVIRSWCLGGITPILGDAFAQAMLPHCRKTCNLCSTTQTTTTTTTLKPITRPPTTTTTTRKPPTTPTPINPDEFECSGKGLIVVRIEKTVVQAREYCELQSQHLLIINNLFELDCLRARLLQESDNRTTQHIWRVSGQVDRATNTWSWDDPEVPFQKELFSPASNALEINGNCIALKYFSSTNRIELIGYDCITPRHYICQK